MGEGKMHRKHADDGRNDAIAIPVGFQRDQKHAEYKDHGHRCLRGEDFLNQKINGKGAAKNKNRKQNIFLSLTAFHGNLSKGTF